MRRRLLLGLLAIGAGTIGVVIGVGVGLPHLAKAGWSVATLVGLAFLGGGAALMAVGFRQVFGATHRPVRWLLVPLTLVVLAGGLLTLGQALAATWVPPIALGGRTPDDVGLAAEDVVLETADGVALAGWYAPGPNGAAVVLAHGAGSSRTAVLDHAAVLADHGYGVLLVDARGHGASGGRAMDLGWWGDEDLGAAVDFLVGEAGVDAGRIGLLGLSMGGEEAIGAMAADERVGAVVAEGATVRVAADKDWLSDEYGWRGALQERLEGATTWWADRFTGADPPGSLRDAVAAAAPRPVLLIAAGAVADEARAGEFIRGGAPDSVTLWEVSGADHTGGLRTEPDEWEQRVVAFLDGALDPA